MNNKPDRLEGTYSNPINNIDHIQSLNQSSAIQGGMCYEMFHMYAAKLFACWVIFQAFLSSADFFQNQLFQKILSGIPSECQMVWILIRPDVLSGLIWVKTVCKDHQQTTNNIDHIQSLNQSSAIQGGMC